MRNILLFFAGGEFPFASIITDDEATEIAALVLTKGVWALGPRFSADDSSSFLFAVFPTRNKPIARCGESGNLLAFRTAFQEPPENTDTSKLQACVASNI